MVSVDDIYARPNNITIELEAASVGRAVSITVGGPRDIGLQLVGRRV